MSILKSNSAFTLVEVILVGAVMGGLALAMSQITKNQMKASQSVSSIVDRDALQASLTSFFSNQDNCKKILGNLQNLDFSSAASGKINISTLYNPVTNSPYLISSRAMGGSRIFIGQMLLDGSASASVAVTATTESKIVSLLVPTKKLRSGIGATIDNTGGETNVGGDQLRDLLPFYISMVLDTNTHALISCSLSGSNTTTGSNCTTPGSALVNGPGGTVCQKVSCGTGTFNAGVYAKTTIDNATGITMNPGDAKCCALGTHVAGTSYGTPVCCGTQELFSAGLCVGPSSKTLCPAAYTETVRRTDGGAQCCRTRYTSGGSDENASITCEKNTGTSYPPEYLLSSTPTCNVGGNVSKLVGADLVYNWTAWNLDKNSGPATGISTKCTGTPAGGYVDCCIDMNPTFSDYSP